MRPTALHRLRNLFHAGLLLAGMAALGWAVTAALFGPAAGVWGLLGVALSLLLAPAAPKGLLLRAYGARPLGPAVFHWGNDVVAALARRAALPAVPGLWLIPSPVPNAFAIGTGRDSAIAVSDGMLRLLDAQELVGVLAHEVSHIAHGDLWVMAFADLTARLVSVASMVGQFLLLVNLPLLAAGAVTVSWWAVGLLIVAPTVASLLQLALSRTREFDADLGAAQLTGDPASLASALARLDRRVGRIWEEIVLPGRRIPEPSLLRTHPPTGERIARLMALAPASPLLSHRTYEAPRVPAVSGAPRWRSIGLWY
jgi:heat shock protein HtpX